MSSRVLAHCLAPFQGFLAQENTTDIVVNRPGEIGVKAGGTWSWHDETFLTYDRLDAIAILCAYHTGQDIDEVHPLCATTLPTGERLQICRFPVTAPGVISLSIRRPPSFRPTLETSVFERAPPPEALVSIAGDDADLLQKAALNRKNIIISGPVGTRKTTVTKAIIEAIPLHERLITIEDTPEWNTIPHRNWASLRYSKGAQSAAKIGSEELIEASLRMIPDRILIQELRDGAAYAYLRAILPHPGGITSVHARSPSAAKEALRLMIRQHPTGATMDDKDIRAQLEEQIDLIVQMHPEQRGDTYRISDIYVRPE